MKRSSGFTLIELLIVVAVIGILAAIAYPSYNQYLMKGRRASAQAHLMDVAQVQQQYLLDNRTYASSLADLNMTVPEEVSKFYTITVVADDGPPPTFNIQAAPIAGGPQESDGNLTIFSDGSKTPADKW